MTNEEKTHAKMRGELGWIDLQFKYHQTGDIKRSISTIEALSAYAIQCRDHVQYIDDVLTIVGDKPTRPE